MTNNNKDNGISRRDFLKNFGAALGLCMANGSTAFDMVGNDASITIVNTAPLHMVAKALTRLTFNADWLRKGVYDSQTAMVKIDELMKDYRRFWDTALQGNLATLKPEEMAKLMVQDFLAKGRISGHDVPGNIEFHTDLMKMGMEFVKKSESELLDNLMEKAQEGFAHYKFIEKENGGRTIRRGIDKNLRKLDPPEKFSSLNNNADNMETLEHYFGRPDVRVIQKDTGLHIASLDKNAIAAIARLLDVHNQLTNDYSLTLQSVPHSVRSLARPYIANYQQLIEKAAQR